MKDARAVAAECVEVPAGYRLAWAGPFQYFERARERLKVVLPVTLFR